MYVVISIIPETPEEPASARACEHAVDADPDCPSSAAFDAPGACAHRPAETPYTGTRMAR